jgi:beta-glucosidase-like glycosyl hydrolase
MITGLLRNDLHFTGVVFSDDMQMKPLVRSMF